MGSDIALDKEGNVYITGFTESRDFPLVNASQPYNGGGADAFVTKLDAQGAIVFSTYLGGIGTDIGRSIAVDGEGNSFVTGYTISNNFPTTNPFQAGLMASPSNTDTSAAFVTKFDSTGKIAYSTYLGGSAGDGAFGIAVDADDYVYVTGETRSIDFPTVGAFQATSHGGLEAFVTKLDRSGSSLVYSTYLGGSNAERGFDIAVGKEGNIYIAGRTTSPNFPTMHAAQAAHGGNIYPDGFLTSLTQDGSQLQYSTFIGGDTIDEANALAIDSHGNAYVTGSAGEHLPNAAHLRNAPLGADYGFLAKYNPQGALDYTSYLSGLREGLGISVDGEGNIYVSGEGIGVFLAKIDASVQSYVYATEIRGNGLFNEGSSVTVDVLGNAYVTGHTFSSDLPFRYPPAIAQGKIDTTAFVAKMSPQGGNLPSTGSRIRASIVDLLILACLLIACGTALRWRFMRPIAHRV